jgi:hypothetical protein
LYTGDPRALGRTKYSRASMRADHSVYAGYGTTPAKYIAENTDINGAALVEWYETESDLIAERGIRRQRDPSWPLFFWVHGHKIPYRKCMGSIRLLHDLSYDLTHSDALGPSIEYHDFGNGADVRSRLCGSLSIPILKGYETRWLRVDDSFELRFVKNKKVFRDTPVDEKKWGKDVIGIEFRAIDNMPSKQIDSLLHLIVLVAAAAVAPRKHAIDFLKHAAVLSETWHAALRDVRKYGSHAPADSSYLKGVCHALDLDFNSTFPDNSLTMFEALNFLAKQLHEVHAHSHLISLMHPKCVKGPPVFDNVGQAAWEEAWHAADKKTRDKASRNPNNAAYIRNIKQV